MPNPNNKCRIFSSRPAYRRAKPLPGDARPLSERRFISRTPTPIHPDTHRTKTQSREKPRTEPRRGPPRTEILTREEVKKPGSMAIDAASGYGMPSWATPAGLSAPGIPADAPQGYQQMLPQGYPQQGYPPQQCVPDHFPSFRHFFALRVASARTSPLTSPSRSPSLRMMQPPPQQQQQGNWKDQLALPPRAERYRTEVRRARRSRAVPADRPVAFLPGRSLALPRNDPLARSRAAPRGRPASSHTPRGDRS